MTEQAGLFPVEETAAAESADTSSRRVAPGGSPQRAQEVMAEIKAGRYGVLDVTDRVVWFVDDRQVRHSADEDVVSALMREGYAVEAADRHRVSARHGAVARPVTPVRLTPAGRRLLDRWSAYKPMPS